jgi:hypothetical protein
MPDDKRSQSDKFKDAARALECDEDEARWDERLKKGVKQKTPEPLKLARATSSASSDFGVR